MKRFRIYPDFGSNNKLNREIWLEKAISKIPRGQSILDAGAGETQYRKFCEHLVYTAQDFGEYSGEGNEGLQKKEWDNSKLDIISDITSIPVDNNSYDNIICIEVFEHLPQPQLAIREFSRIIKPNGKLIITAPFASLTHFAPYFFASGYSKYFYEKFLEENGFSILEISYNGNYFEYLAQELRRILSMGKKYSTIGVLRKLALKVLISPLLLILSSLSKNDNGSEESLCFGLHILAEKK
jgi:ubiquinone/menaquinone biosynthesis C-methylase UbiE